MSAYVRHVKQPTKLFASRFSQVDIELTERCNNDCIHCCINRPANDAAARAREMTTEQVKDILQQAAGLGCMLVRFTGGEPLLRPDFEELYVFARRLGLKVLLFTNARLLTPHLVDLLERIPPLAEIEISVYGMRQQSYEAVTRAPGSFTQFWRGVNLLLERNVPFMVKGALLPPNKHEIDELEAWAKTIPWVHARPNYAMVFDLRQRRDDTEKNALIESLRHSPQDGLAVLARDDAKYRRTMAPIASDFMGPHGGQLFNCGAGYKICVDAYGRIQPCMGMRAPELTYQAAGANSHSLLQDAMDRFSHLGELRATNPDYLRRCAVCFLKGFCEQCPAKSWVEYGTLDTPIEYLCEVAHAQARYLGWLDENERAWQVTDGPQRVRSSLVKVDGWCIISKDAARQ
jgi:radical SAM protein with 4Fe4S-binding SPASM domain